MQSSTARTALELSPTCPKVGWAQELCSLISPSPETKPQSHLSWMEAMTQCNSFLLLATASTQFHILPLLILRQRSGARTQCTQCLQSSQQRSCTALHLHSAPPPELSRPGKGIEDFLQYARKRKKKSEPDSAESKQEMPSLRIGKAFTPHFKNFLQSKFNESRDKTDAKAHFAQ